MKSNLQEEPLNYETVASYLTHALNKWSPPMKSPETIDGVVCWTDASNCIEWKHFSTWPLLARNIRAEFERVKVNLDAAFHNSDLGGTHKFVGYDFAAFPGGELFLQTKVPTGVVIGARLFAKERAK